MRKFAAAGVAAIFISVIWPGGASAQATYNVAAGHQLRVLWAYSLNPDCSSLGQVVVRVTQQPQHGRIAVRNGHAFPTFASSNSRSVCNTRRVPGVEAYYQAPAGFTGFDSVGFEAIFPSGSYQQITRNIQVR
jgi:hypothetical protein